MLSDSVIIKNLVSML